MLSVFGWWCRSACRSNNKIIKSVDWFTDWSKIMSLYDLLALVFDSFDWYDCFGAHLIRTRRTWWMTVTIFALQCATFHISTENEVSKNKMKYLYWNSVLLWILTQFRISYSRHSSLCHNDHLLSLWYWIGQSIVDRLPDHHIAKFFHIDRPMLDNLH